MARAAVFAVAGACVLLGLPVYVALLASAMDEILGTGIVESIKRWVERKPK